MLKFPFATLDAANFREPRIILEGKGPLSDTIEIKNNATFLITLTLLVFDEKNLGAGIYRFKQYTGP